MKGIIFRKTISDYIDIFLKNCVIEGKEEETLKTYKSILMHFLNYLTRRKIYKLRKIKPAIILDYQIYLSQTHTKTTCNNKAKVINIFLKSINHPYLLKKVTVHEEIKPSFNKSDVIKILDNIDYKNISSVICYFLLGTGIRSKSLRFLKVRDLDLTNQIVLLRKTKTHQEYAIPLSSELVEILNKYINYHNLNSSDYLFLNRAGNQIERSDLYRIIETYLKNIGVKEKGVHIFRHTFCKACCLNGIDAITLQRLMGHANMNITSKYINFYNPELKEAGMQFNPISNNRYLQYLL